MWNQIVLDRDIFLRERSSRRKIQRSKTITDVFIQWPKNRWCKVIIVINNHSLDIFNAFYRCNLWRNRPTVLNLFLTHCLPIPVREFWSVQAWRSSRNVINAHVCDTVCALRALVWRKLNENAFGAHDITYAGHYEKSLYSDNDLHCHSCKMKIISSDWIAPLRSLLIHLIYHRRGRIFMWKWSKGQIDLEFWFNLWTKEFPLLQVQFFFCLAW